MGAKKQSGKEKASKTEAHARHIQQINEKWLGCPYCDALWQRPRLAPGQSARCRRCHNIIIRRRAGGTERTLAMMIASLVLYIIAVSFPFLQLERAGLSHEMSVIDATTVLWQNKMHTLSIIVALFVLIFPILRILLLIYISLIVSLQKPTNAREARLFRLSEKIDRWTMSEIFVIGVIVSLVEIIAMARVELLPGFWAMAGMILLLALGSTALCRDTIWINIRAQNDAPSKAFNFKLHRKPSKGPTGDHDGDHSGSFAKTLKQKIFKQKTKPSPF